MQCMLSLNDCLTVGSIQINVLEVWHDSVRLGINDPDACPSYREEILYLPSDEDNDDSGLDMVFEPIEIQKTGRYAVSAL